jgi:hypothetical protein
MRAAIDIFVLLGLEESAHLLHLALIGQQEGLLR